MRHHFHVIFYLRFNLNTNYWVLIASRVELEELLEKCDASSKNNVTDLMLVQEIKDLERTL